MIYEIIASPTRHVIFSTVFYSEFLLFSLGLRRKSLTSCFFIDAADKHYNILLRKANLLRTKVKEKSFRNSVTDSNFNTNGRKVLLRDFTNNHR